MEIATTVSRENSPLRAGPYLLCAYTGWLETNRTLVFTPQPDFKRTSRLTRAFTAPVKKDLRMQIVWLLKCLSFSDSYHRGECIFSGANEYFKYLFSYRWTAKIPILEIKSKRFRWRCIGLQSLGFNKYNHHFYIYIYVCTK